MLSVPICVLVAIVHVCSGVDNLNVTRKIDIRGGVVRIENEILTDAAGSHYQFHVDPLESHFSHISAKRSDKKPLPIKANLAEPGVYTIDLSKEGKNPVQLVVTVVLTDALEPKPTEILQNERQFIKYSGNIMFFSPYLSKHQETHIILPDGEVLRYTTAPEPITKQTKKLIYGPYYNVGAKSHVPLRVHFENNRPFLVVKKMTRHIEISNWGNIAVEETLEIQNMGARLTGPFSRLDFDMGHGQQHAIVSFKTALPAAAKDIYYRDEIGNVSSSSVMDLVDTVEVKLSPRFPLMGGWKTQYILGYNVPAYEFLYRTGSQFTLRMRFLDHVYDDQVVEDLTVKIVLPEMASNIDFRPPFPVEEQAKEILKTYLDTVGRTVLVFKAKNLVSEHIQDFTLNYQFQMIYMLREPLMLVTAFCVIFASILVYVRLDFSIFKDEKNELRLRVQAMVDQVQELCKQRSALYQTYEDAVSQYKSQKDSAAFSFERRKLEAECKAVNASLSQSQSQLAELYPDGVEKIKELLAYDASYRDLLQESAQLAERLVNGKITKQQYQTSDSEVNSKKTDLINRMDVVLENL